MFLCYNNLDAVTKVSYPDGTSETTDYTCCGIPGVVKDRAGRKSYYDYDVMKRLTRVQDASGNTLQLDLDAMGNLVRLVDSKGHLTRWSYDAADRVTGKMYADGTTEGYAYDRGLLGQSQGARGQVVKYGYDANSNLTLVDYPNMADVSLSYNALDDVTQIVDGVGTNTFTYDNLGRLTALTGPFANDGQTFSYDALQRLSSQSVGTGRERWHPEPELRLRCSGASVESQLQRHPGRGSLQLLLCRLDRDAPEPATAKRHADRAEL